MAKFRKCYLLVNDLDVLLQVGDADKDAKFVNVLSEIHILPYYIY